MKQLRPKSILAIGICGSLVLSLATVCLVLYFLGESKVGWMAILAIGGSGWFFLGVPTFCGMAFIRHKIGQVHAKREKIIRAIICWAACILIAGTGIAAGIQFQYTSAQAFGKVLALLAGSIGATLVLLTSINILLRFKNDDWIPDIGQKPKFPVKESATPS